ncbi:MAG: DEAD/DEAH box helicase family protein [Planctomycetota bacterium]
MQAQSVSQYFATYGNALSERVRTTFRPHHVPAKDRPITLDLLRTAFPAQAHAISGIVKSWRGKQKSLALVAECGTGKTFMGIAAVHAASRGKPYRALVFCPPHLVEKWKREVAETIPLCTTRSLDDWQDVFRLPRGKPSGNEWVIISQSIAKLGPRWKPAVARRKGHPVCPDCHGRLVKKPGEHGTDPEYYTLKELASTKRYCKNEVEVVQPDGTLKARKCGSRLWKYVADPRKWAVASTIKQRYANYFNYLIVDEVHEEKGEGSVQGHAMGRLTACCRKVLCLTGTLIGGYADDLLPLLYRMDPTSLVEEQVGWGQTTEFLRRYGKVEKVITTTIDEGRTSMRTGSGYSRRKIEIRRPGVMPTLYGRHLADKCIFLSLEDIADSLPPYQELAVAVPLTGQLADAYTHVEEALRDEVKEMMKKSHGKDKRLLSKMLQTLLAYPDHPFGFDEIGYSTQDGWKHVVQPAELSRKVTYAKEQRLVELVKQQRAEGRQTWVFIQYNDKYDVMARLATKLGEAGLKVKTLRSNDAKTVEREAWIQENGPGTDVIISHPDLVKTGLDFFDRAGMYNFSSLIFYETGYNLFTLRQASRRAWRIGQKRACRVYFFYYEDTMQEKALSLMGKKLRQAMAIEGRLDAEGLGEMGGDDEDGAMALAKSLAGQLDLTGGDRVWKKIGGTPGKVVKQVFSQDILTKLAAMADDDDDLL